MPDRVRRRVLGLLACLGLGALLGVLAYVGVIGIPFGPKAEGDIELARSGRPGQRVLFVGNSLTYYNDMPSMVRKLAVGDQGGPTLFVAQYTAPGWSLRRASSHDGLRALLEDVRWDDVVLQERSDESRPFVHELHERVAAGGGRTTLVILGAALDRTYAELAQTLPASLAFVGPAAEEALSRNPGLDMLADDEGHPNRAVSFLIACVVYATLTNRDPSLSAYAAGLEPGESRFLKRVAWDVYRGRDTAAAR